MLEMHAYARCCPFIMCRMHHAAKPVDIRQFAYNANHFLSFIRAVYASPSSRTPPLIQAVLQNTGFLFSVPFSIWVSAVILCRVLEAH